MSSDNRHVEARRIVDKRFADEAFSGTGAERFGGRFNSRGRKVIYTSSSLSLALLELLVQINNRDRLRGYVCIPVRFPRDQVTRIQADALPDGWNALPFGHASQQIGDAWLDAGSSLALQVPTVVVPLEWNFLINPAHPDFSSLEIGEPQPVTLFLNQQT